MSSDAYYLEITHVAGAVLGLAGTSWQDPNGIASTRSFVLLALARAGDIVPVALARALAERDFDEGANDREWYVKNVGEFVESAELVRQEGRVANPAPWLAARNEAYEALCATGLDDQAIDAALGERFPPPVFTVRATMTSPRYLAGLRPGMRFGTTAWDVWLDDDHSLGR